MVSITSTASLTNALRRSVLDTQNQITRAQTEVSSGRVADLGLDLGMAAGRDYALGMRDADLASIANSNGVVATRLASSETALGSIADTAQSFLETLVSAQSGAGSDAGAIRDNAVAGLKSLISGLNTSVAGVYIFGGTNISAPPLSDYFSEPLSAAKISVDDAFQAAFGVAPDSSDAGSITADQMQSFLSGAFADLFSETGWTDNWSSASNESTTNRISLSQIAETSVSANETPLRQIAMAYTMIADLSLTELGSETYAGVLKTAAESMGQAITNLTRLRSSVGVMQSNIDDATATITAQRNVIATQIGSLENIDPFEASTRLNNLTTQLETSYTLTGKIQQLTLAKYL
jgi:flagellar hook-associated protein 3 FlgL